MKKRKCEREPGLACFTCPFRDCVRGGDWFSAWERAAYAEHVPFARHTHKRNPPPQKETGATQ